MFVFCQCFTIIPDIHEFVCTISGSQCKDIVYSYSIIEFGHLMLAVNSSVNFLFYIIHIQLLRDEIKKVICYYDTLLDRYQNVYHVNIKTMINSILFQVLGCFVIRDRDNSNRSRKDCTVETLLSDSNVLVMGPVLRLGSPSEA